MNFNDKLKPLVSSGLQRQYNAGSTILYQGEVPRSAFVLNKGFVKSFNISSDGSEQIVNFHVPGEVLPLEWIFGKTSATVYFFEAMTDTTITLIQRDQLLEYIKRDKAVLESLLDYAVGNYTAAMLHICALEQAKAQQKILYTLYYLARRFGTANSQKTVDILLELTHQDIASLVGLTRETTATELNKLKKEKILTYQNKKYKVDVKKLVEVMGEESFLAIRI